MKKKFLVALFAAMMLVALPTAAFAANSPTGTTTKDFSGVQASASCTGKDVTNLQITGPAGGLGTYDVTWSDGTVDDFGNLTLTFGGLSAYNGQTVTVTANHSDGTVETFTVVVQNGTVSVTVSKLSTFTIALADGTAASSSATSPKTGVDFGMVAAGAGLMAVAAGGVFLAMRKQNQR